MLERRIRRDRAAAKIQAAYRGYTVRKSLQWNNEKQKHLKSEFNKRVSLSIEFIFQMRSHFVFPISQFINHQKCLHIKQIYLIHLQ
jgi:hypothetical protein